MEAPQLRLLDAVLAVQQRRAVCFLYGKMSILGVEDVHFVFILLNSQKSVPLHIIIYNNTVPLHIIIYNL